MWACRSERQTDKEPDRVRAIDELEKALSRGDPTVKRHASLDPLFAPLFDDDRFNDLVGRKKPERTVQYVLDSDAP